VRACEKSGQASCGHLAASVLNPARLRWGDDHTLADGRFRHAVQGLQVVGAHHVGQHTHDLEISKLLTLAEATTTTERNVRKLAGGTINESVRLELHRVGEQLGLLPRHIRRHRHHAAAPNVVLLELDISLNGPHQQHQRWMHAQGLGDRTSHLGHLLIGTESEGGTVSTKQGPLLCQQIGQHLRSGDNLQCRPGRGDRAVMHATEERGDEEADNLLIADFPTVGIGGEHHLPQEVVLLLHLPRGDLPPALRQDRGEELVHLSAGDVPVAMPGDWSMRHENGQRQQPLLQGVKQVTNAPALASGMHLRTELGSHETSDGRPGEALDH